METPGELLSDAAGKQVGTRQIDADVHEHRVETFSEPFECRRGVSPGGRPGFQVMDLIDENHALEKRPTRGAP
ncbi:MAG: hypothetical protein R2703_15620 [Micropruina glycogenica]